MASWAARSLWLAGGLGCVVLGSIGIIVPGLPTTVFFIMAAACFSRSSPRLEQWVLTRPVVAHHRTDTWAGLGMPRRAKVAAVTSIVVMCGLSAGFAVERTWVRLLIVGVGAAGVGWILWRIPTRVGPGNGQRAEPGHGDRPSRDLRGPS